jgi:UDP-N-acetylmuramate dehydrogenase
MIQVDRKPVDLQEIELTFGARLRREELLTRYTAARLGGSAEALLEVQNKKELAQVVRLCWSNGIPFVILGGGSNVLVSDAGVRGLVIINRARRVQFDEKAKPPSVWAESGANFGALARQAAQRGLSGLEWAAGIPGTVGGAVVGNAGAHGAEIADDLLLAEILHYNWAEGDSSIQIERWEADQLAYSYRSSVLKHWSGRAVVLAACLRLERREPEKIEAKMQELATYRRRTQPPGATIGSMFKNPPGDYAGRLIEAAGLKGLRVGDAQISEVHANFFINLGQASASDFYSLIQMTKTSVVQQFGVNLELEIELLGEW